MYVEAIIGTTHGTFLRSAVGLGKKSVQNADKCLKRNNSVSVWFV